MRQIVLDTETTGLEPQQGHRIIEIGCVEMIDRRLSGNNFHQYLQPDREIDAGAIEVHGITNEFLADKPRFADLAADFLDYIRGAELIIHNAPFDVGFLNHELQLMGADSPPIGELCAVIDTLVMAKKMHPGQRNSLDALCKRYDVDNTQRELHGALLDAEILADVYLAMTGGQATLSLEMARAEGESTGDVDGGIRRLSAGRPALKVVKASAVELELHEARLEAMGEGCIWRKELPAE
ncbi:DNA polymerase III subunit epsilon [endosymbiont of Ridgeia piscesae]|jgi:DNA polymerase-3 subunit epsilon|uniref:DNA polymerase III subunit epsilon n=1 Tax=endosymbiont of Ridgeia piscesae TaxID=54398 RepID=A0A0T5Z5H5_9GAMM|nr:DNA polymerase III subunit epsilon [endosymbiont of Ridgeia piscesae]KRT54497.1 DNA polymerase III, epsilon subunit [endosymbiont of Ridgeia piscesae]KRT57749.1 DNA polymerase III, epsilon subunit [endosymbiont of Ridgeia piscesae]